MIRTEPSKGQEGYSHSMQRIPSEDANAKIESRIHFNECRGSNVVTRSPGYLHCTRRCSMIDSSEFNDQKLYL